MTPLDPTRSYPAFMLAAHRESEQALADFRKARTAQEKRAAKDRVRHAQDLCERRYAEWESLP